MNAAALSNMMPAGLVSQLGWGVGAALAGLFVLCLFAMAKNRSLRVHWLWFLFESDPAKPPLPPKPAPTTKAAGKSQRLKASKSTSKKGQKK